MCAFGIFQMVTKIVIQHKAAFHSTHMKWIEIEMENVCMSAICGNDSHDDDNSSKNRTFCIYNLAMKPPHIQNVWYI